MKIIEVVVQGTGTDVMINTNHIVAFGPNPKRPSPGPIEVEPACTTWVRLTDGKTVTIEEAYYSFIERLLKLNDR